MLFTAIMEKRVGNNILCRALPTLYRGYTTPSAPVGDIFVYTMGVGRLYERRTDASREDRGLDGVGKQSRQSRLSPAPLPRWLKP